MLKGSYPIFKIWMTPKKHIFDIWGFERKGPLVHLNWKKWETFIFLWRSFAWFVLRYKETLKRKLMMWKGKKICQIRSAWIKRVRSDPPAATDRSRMESIFVKKRKSLQTWEVRVFFAKRELGGETPTMVFKKYHVVEPTISFFRLRFSNNIRPLSCSPF